MKTWWNSWFVHKNVKMIHQYKLKKTKAKIERRNLKLFWTLQKKSNLYSSKFPSLAECEVKQKNALHIKSDKIFEIRFHVVKAVLQQHYMIIAILLTCASYVIWHIWLHLTHSIWQIQLWCPRSKWNMGEILAFSGLKMMMKSGLGKIFLKFLHALTMLFLLLNLFKMIKIQ